MKEIWTDGSSTGGKGDGGTAAIILDDNFPKLAIVHTQYHSGLYGNNEMEISAVLLGLVETDLNDVVKVFTDNKGVIEWIAKRWQAKTGIIPKVRDEILHKTDVKGLNITYTHIPGHSGYPYNEAADILAKRSKENRKDYSFWIPREVLILGSKKDILRYE